MHMLSIFMALIATGVFLTLALQAMETENNLIHTLNYFNKTERVSNLVRQAKHMHLFYVLISFRPLVQI